MSRCSSPCAAPTSRWASSRAPQLRTRHRPERRREGGRGFADGALDAAGRTVGKGARVFAALYAVAAGWRQDKERARLEAEEAAMQQCTFAPDMHASAASLGRANLWGRGLELDVT